MRPTSTLLLLATTLAGASHAATLINPSFEAPTLIGWEITQGNVELVTADTVAAADGNQALDLNGDQPGGIAQTVTGLDPARPYTLQLAYADQKPRGNHPVIATAEIHANGELITTLRNTSDAPNYIDGIGFLVRPNASGELRLEFRSTLPGPFGFIIDHIRLTPGPPAALPESPALANASFEAAIPPHFGDNPHLFGHQLPGWLVLRENIDVISYDRFGAPDGKACVDLGGHGAGGIGQIITGLNPGGRYRLSLKYARHTWWEQEDPLTAEIYLNGTLAMRLARDKTQKAPVWESAGCEVTIPSDGRLRLEMFSTAYTVGGGVLFDDLRLDPVADIPRPGADRNSPKSQK